jgi:hypothetical protein
MGRKLTADEKKLVEKWVREKDPKFREAEAAGRDVQVVVGDELTDDGRVRYAIHSTLITEGMTAVPPPSN